LQQARSTLLELTDIPNQEFLNLLDTSSWLVNLSGKYYPDENHFSIPVKATYDALRFFYDYYSFPEIMNYYHPAYSDKNDLVIRLQQHFEMISKKMQCNKRPMEGYINSFAFGLGVSGRNDLAVELFNYNITSHPDRPIFRNNLGYYYRNQGAPKKAIEQFTKSLQLRDDEGILDILNQLKKELAADKNR